MKGGNELMSENLLFSLEDRVIVRSLIKGLPEKQKKAIILHFWKNQSISKVAKKMDINWEEAEKIITKGLLKIKKQCMEHPRCSRFLHKASILLLTASLWEDTYEKNKFI